MAFRPGSEDETHHAILTWLGWVVPGIEVCHVANGFYAGDDENDPTRRKARAHLARLKALGLKPGTFDLLCFPGEGRVFWLEIKRPKGGVVSTAQEDFGASMTRLGIPWAIVRSIDETREFLASINVLTREAQPA